MSNKFKVALIASLLLNLAFVVGFVVKKYLFAQPHPIKKNLSQCRQAPCNVDAKNVGYLHFCKRPGFKKNFHKYQDQYRQAAENLRKVKKAYLLELKKESVNQEILEKYHQEIIRASNLLIENNNDHMLALKKILKPKDLECLINCMIHALESHNEMPFYVDETFCNHHPKENRKKHQIEYKIEHKIEHNKELLKGNHKEHLKEKEK